jgi:predicted AAA+ superfamily ATPase
VSAEIPDFDLLRALQHGLIPKHYLCDPAFLNEYLEAYVDIYLTDEIRNEGLVRNLAGFARFLDVAGLTNGEMINHTNVARDCGIDRATVSGFYQILIDTLIGYYIYPYNKKIKRDLITAMPKFYLFDVGVANYLARQIVLQLRGNVAGKSLEHFILMELIAYLSLHRKRDKIYYWRTKTGLEVDFIIGDAKVAIEVKIDGQVHKQDIKGLVAFCEEHSDTTALVVSQDTKKRKMELESGKAIMIMPWREFLSDLWGGKII